MAFRSILLLLLAFPHITECRSQEREQRQEPSMVHYDYLVLGAGTAGCLVASRLCSAGHSVALLERGAPRSEQDELYSRAYRLAFDSWNRLNLSKQITGMNNNLVGANGQPGRNVTFYDGANLGGSSAINSQQMVIPVNGTIEEWGIEGLDTDTAFDHFATIYDELKVIPYPSSLLPDYTQETKDAILASVDGIEFLDHPIHGSDREQLIISPTPITEGGERIDSCAAFLKPVIDSTCANTLHLIQSATVTKILVEDHQATGVEYVDSGDSHMQNKKYLYGDEVISCMGAFGSPKVLQLSGIGPRDLLDEHGIPIVVDLPVGMQTLARPSVGIIGFYTGVPLDSVQNVTDIFSVASITQFQEGRGGPLGKSNVPLMTLLGRKGYVDTGLAAPTEGHPFTGLPAQGSFCLLNSTAPGSIKIADANPFSTVEFDSNLLGNDKDFQDMVDCISRFRPVYQNFPPEFGMIELGPGATLSVAEWVSTTADTVYHVVGGNAVGKVVDSELRVMGVDKLRIIDVSVLPQLTAGGGPIASVYMLASYMSEKILGETATGKSKKGKKKKYKSKSKATMKSKKGKEKEGRKSVRSRSKDKGY